MTIEQITLAVTALGWIVTAFFQRRLYLLQAKTQTQLADQQEQFNRERELREYVLPDRLSTLAQLQQWFNEGFALYQDVPKNPTTKREVSKLLDVARRHTDWGNKLILFQPWAMFYDPYPPGSKLWFPGPELPSDKLLDLMYALRYLITQAIVPGPHEPPLPIPARRLIEEIRIDSFDAIERVRVRVLAALKEAAH